MTCAIIEDGVTPKTADNPSLSPRAMEIVAKVQPAHDLWLEISKWGRKTLTRGGTLTAAEGIAILAYENLRKNLTWPLWSSSMTDEAIKGQMFSIQATHRRILRLVPNAFSGE